MDCGAFAAHCIPGMAAIGKEKAAPSLEEYQQSSGFLTVAGRHKSALHEVPTISNGTSAQLGLIERRLPGELYFCPRRPRNSSVRSTGSATRFASYVS